MKMFIAGKWVEGSEKIDVRNPFDNAVIDTVPKATVEDVDRGWRAWLRGPRSCGGCRATSVSRFSAGRPI